MKLFEIRITVGSGTSTYYVEAHNHYTALVKIEEIPDKADISIHPSTGKLVK